MSRPIVRVSANDPQRCQGSTKNGPCYYKQVSGSTCCPLHGGAASELAQDKRELRNYRLNTAAGERAKEMSGSGDVKNLGDEIHLMRAALETVFNNIQSPNDMMIHMDKIHKLTDGIGKLAATWQKLEKENKELLGRDTVLMIFDQLLSKIAERVNDPDVVAALAEDSFDIISKCLEL